MDEFSDVDIRTLCEWEATYAASTLGEPNIDYTSDDAY